MEFGRKGVGLWGISVGRVSAIILIWGLFLFSASFTVDDNNLIQN